MRKPMLGVVAGLLLAGMAVEVAQAAAPKPVVVVTIAAYDELMGDLKFVGELAGQPELADGVDGMIALMTAGRGLEGLDKTRPAGVIIQADGDLFSGYGFVPVTNLKKLLRAVEPIVGKIRETDGVFQIDTDQGQTLFAKEAGQGWAVIGDDRDALDRAPADPQKVIGPLAKKHDVAARWYIHNLPEAMRREFITGMKQGVRQSQQQEPGESDDDFAIRKWSAYRTVDLLIAAMKDLDEVSLGWSLDRKAETLHFDLDGTVLPDSDGARWLSGPDKSQSQFAGFLVPGAAMSGNMTGQMPPGLTKAVSEAFGKIRAAAMKEIDLEMASKKEAEIEKKLAKQLLDVMEKSVTSGRVDGAMSLVLGPKTFTLVAGTYVADGPAVEKIFTQLIEAAREEAPKEFAEFKVLKAGKCEGVALHAFSVPVPDDLDQREQFIELFGDPLEFALGVGKESLYFAMGRDALKTLRRAIKRSAKEEAEVDAMSLSVAVKPFAEFMAEVGDLPEEREEALRVAEALEKMSGRDRVTLKLQTIDRGVHFRLEVEPDVLKLIGIAAQEE